MKLILSSCDFHSEKAKQTILGNLNKPIADCRLLFIPNEKATPETIRSEKYYLRMQKFGFSRKSINVFDYSDAQAFEDIDLDVIYISGGNTFETLKRLRNCGFDQKIVQYIQSGVIYIGGSAGAHIASADVSHVRMFDAVPDDMTDFCGLGLFDGILICHYTSERKALFEQLKAEGKYKVFALSDEDSLVVNTDIQ